MKRPFGNMRLSTRVRRAADLVSPEKWCQGYLAMRRDKDGTLVSCKVSHDRAEAFCALGALRFFGALKGGWSALVFSAFAEAIGEDPYYACYETVSDYNDRDGRKATEVRSALRRTSRILAKQGR